MLFYAVTEIFLEKFDFALCLLWITQIKMIYTCILWEKYSPN